MNNVSHTSMPANINTKQDINLISDASLAAKNAKVAAIEKPENTPAIKSADVLVKATDTEVEQALSVVNKAAVFEQRSLSFTMDEDSGRSVVTVKDKNTDQVIRQIPSEELLKVSQDIKKLQDEMGQSLGLLIDRRV